MRVPVALNLLFLSLSLQCCVLFLKLEAAWKWYPCFFCETAVPIIMKYAFIMGSSYRVSFHFSFLLVWFYKLYNAVYSGKRKVVFKLKAEIWSVYWLQEVPVKFDSLLVGEEYKEFNPSLEESEDSEDKKLLMSFECEYPGIWLTGINGCMVIVPSVTSCQEYVT